MKEFNIFNERNLTEKVHYVYRVTIDEKYYIGKRTGFLNDLITGRYKTSSKPVKEKLQNGLHFSKIKILQVFSSSKEALEFEERILTRLKARTNPKFLNQSNGRGNDFCLKQHTQKSKKKMSNKAKERYNPETEEGKKNLENHSKNMKKGVETRVKNRKNASVLGELMFDEDFIRENFLITDDKNNPRFLLSAYSKLSRFSKSRVYYHKQKGELSFLYGIKSIKLSKEDENTKIKEIEAIIKSRNEKE